jgi:ATP-dependent DNA helicase PIF1
MSNTSYITSRAILSTRNDWVDMINMRMIDRFQGEQMMYHSFDTAVDDPNNYYPSEFLNTLTPNRLPPHVLKLKVGCPIMLLRNVDPANGLCNGTRLVVHGFQKTVLMLKLSWASMLECEFSCLVYPYAPLMMRCSLSSLKGSSFR